MKDRIPTKPGRVKVTREDGTWEYATLERADEPKEDGTALNKETLLKDETAAILGLGEDAVPNDAFLRLAFGIGNYGVHIYVKLPDGTPASGVKIAGVTNLLGGALTTNSDGYCFGITKNNPASISATTTWADIKSKTQSFDLSDPISTVTLIMEAKSEKEATYTSSATIMFSSMVKLLDICAVGGGGGGGGSTNDYAPGGGGGGGYVANRLSVAPQEFQVRIGSGGASGGSNRDNYPQPSFTAGGKGGTTTVSFLDGTELSAEGGNGGIGGESGGNSTSSSGITIGRGGSGNGAGGSGGMNSPAGRGGNGAGYKYNDPALGVAGGGGGGGGAQYIWNETPTVAAGGSPGGASGAARNNVSSGDSTLIKASAAGPGGGGGGIYGYSGSNKKNSPGGNGIVYVRWHYREVV